MDKRNDVVPYTFETLGAIHTDGNEHECGRNASEHCFLCDQGEDSPPPSLGLKREGEEEEEGDLNRDGDCCSSSSSSSYSSDADLKWRAVDRCITSALKGFAIGAGLRGGLILFSTFSRLRRKHRYHKAELTQEVIRSGLKETLRYGLFLGSFAGNFSVIEEVIAALGGFQRTASWRALVAGALAGPSLLLTGRDTRHTSMSIYIFLRAAVLAARCGIKSERTRWLFSPLAWKHGDTFLMCLSSSQILTAWILKPRSLPSSYISFLNKHGGKDTRIVKSIKNLALGRPISNLEEVEGYYHSLGIELKIDPNIKIPCTVLHGNQDCVPHFFQFLVHAYLRSLPVYIPVYLVPAVIVHRQGLLQKPFSIILKAVLGVARSSLFLSTFCASAWLWSCALFRAIGMCNPRILAMGTFPTGLAVMIEKKSRRMEIALYCFARALESFAICFGDSKMLPRIKQTNLTKRVDVVLFSCATAIIMHCYSQEREVFRSKYLNVLDWVFGIPIPQGGPPIMSPLVKVSSVPSLLGYNQGK